MDGGFVNELLPFGCFSWKSFTQLCYIDGDV